MDFTLPRKHQLLRQLVREFAEREINPRVTELDETREFPQDILRKMGKLGLVGIFSPEEYGGSNLGHLARMIMIEELARVYPPLGFFFQANHLGIYCIQTFGTEEQKRKYLPSLLSGEKIIATAVTEQSGGSDPGQMSTFAIQDGDEWVINGRKIFITLSAVADYVITITRTGEKSFSSFIVEKETEGFLKGRTEDFTGMKCVPVGELNYINCRVPAKNMLGEEGKGFRAALQTIGDIGRSGAIGVCLGTARGAFETAKAYAKERELYGKPIAELQAIQFHLAEMDMDIEASKWLAYYVAWLIDEGKRGSAISLELARAKAFSNEKAINIAIKAVQVLGACGTIPAYRVSGRLLDTLEVISAGGTLEIMRATIARNILAE